MDTSLKLMSLETGAGREYQYDVDECLLWVTDYDPSVRCVGKKWYPLSWNPIDQIRMKAESTDGLNLSDEDLLT